MNSATFPVYYAEKRIGTLTVDKTSIGVKARFDTLDLQTALDDIGACYFNWIQICTKDTHPPLDTNDKTVKIPYLDPYPGGYALQSFPKFYYWNDGLGYYWDMRKIPTTGNGYYDITCTYQYNTTTTSLLFKDEPSLQDNGEIQFKTWLVAADANFNPTDVFVGFGWGVKDMDGVLQVTLSTCNQHPS